MENPIGSFAVKKTESHNRPGVKLILLGGFLGAGKTTAIVRLVKWLAKQGLRVAVITNDQAGGLVDTEIAKSVTSVVREISGGCFCCRSDELAKTISSLRAEQRPNIIIAEPVGSCTDIRATVIKPLLKVYKTGVGIAPYSVLVDPFAFRRVMGGDTAHQFAYQIDYIIRKQMEEADDLVLNKIDLLSRKQQLELEFLLKKEYAGVKIRSISASNGRGCQRWFGYLLAEDTIPKESIEVDYKKYATGEALLGWLNATAIVKAFDGSKIDPVSLMRLLAEAIQGRLRRKNALIAHFKASFGRNEVRHGGKSDNDKNLYCVAQIGGPTASMTLRTLQQKKVATGRILFNLRAQADPLILKNVFVAAARDISNLANIRIEVLESFRPGAPKPIHRI